MVVAGVPVGVGVPVGDVGGVIGAGVGAGVIGAGQSEDSEHIVCLLLQKQYSISFLAQVFSASWRQLVVSPSASFAQSLYGSIIPEHL